jgi:hypothetical protein
MKRYEAAVKLSTGEVVVYHNINTGLFKFHKFICEKFSKEQKWKYYKVRRIKNKEIIDTFYNEDLENYFRGIKLFVDFRLNSSQTGYIFSLPFERNGYVINRKLFIAKSQVLEEGKNFLSIIEFTFNKMIEEAKSSLYQYYKDKGHQITPNEFTLGEIDMDKILNYNGKERSSHPLIDFP